MWYVLHRDPKSLLVDDWRVMGSAPCKGYPTEDAAKKAAVDLHYSMYYDVQVVCMVSGTSDTQSGSRSDYRSFDN